MRVESTWEFGARSIRQLWHSTYGSVESSTDDYTHSRGGEARTAVTRVEPDSFQIRGRRRNGELSDPLHSADINMYRLAWLEKASDVHSASH